MREHCQMFRSGAILVGTWLAWHIAMPPLSAQAQQLDAKSTAAQVAPVLPRPEASFGGRVSRRASESTPDFPHEVVAPPGAPNILVILTDDVGFSATRPFGGPIPTETFDRLAQNGLRYTPFYTTALCSPTRTALLSGRNHPSAASGVSMELGTDFPEWPCLCCAQLTPDPFATPQVLAVTKH